MRRMGIEELVRWAFREELPKVAPSRGALIANYRHSDRVGGGWDDALMSIDNAYGIVADLYASDEPHPDARLLGDIVRELADLPIVLPDDWNPVADLGLTEDETRDAIRHGLSAATFIAHDGERRLKRGLLNIVRAAAVMRARPVWQADPPERATVKGVNGKDRWFRITQIPYVGASGETLYNSVETSGFDERKRRPYPDAYRKTRLTPDPADAVSDRAEYECWAHVLNVMADELRGHLIGHELEDQGVPNRPWESGDSGEMRILPDMTPVRTIPGRPAAMARDGGKTDRRNVLRYMHLGDMGAAMKRAISTRP